jgi:hypothetical protein
MSQLTAPPSSGYEEAPQLVRAEERSPMKITDVQATWVHVPIPYEHQHTSDFGRIASFDSVVVTLSAARLEVPGRPETPPPLAPSRSWASLRDACASNFLDRFETACRTAAPLMGFLTRAVGLPW